MKISFFLLIILFFSQKLVFSQEIPDFQVISGGFNFSTEGGYENEVVVGEVFVADASALSDTRIQLGLFYTDFTQTIVSIDSTILVKLFEQTNGKKWLNTWDLTKPVSTWYGVTVLGNKVIELNLRENGLKGELPEDFGKAELFSRLEYLNLSNNLISGDIPVNLSKFSELKYLDLSENAFISVPVEVFKLPKLETLWLSDNKISSFPEDLELSNLKNLFLKNNLLENLPTSFGKLNKLKILDLSNNRLKNLPESVGDFTDLEELYLNGNMLSALPNLSKTSLKVLNFAKNEIKNLPTDFGKLQNLQFVDLSLNRLTFYELAPLLNMKFANAIYDPQKTILAPSEISVKLYEDYDLESFAKNFNGNNTYIWFKNNSISTQKQENFGFRNMNKDQIGVYFCEVKNVLFPLLTLRRQETFVKLSCQGSSPILVDVSPALQVCEGETVTLSSKLSNNSEIRWLKDGKLIQNTSNNLRVFESGNYVAEVVADGCTKSSEILQVHFIKSAPILLSLNSDGYTLQANFLDKNAIFQWFVNNEIVAVTQNPVYEVIQRGIYYVKVTNVGCQSISNEVAVQKVSPTATEDEANVENMLVFPNPSHDILFLKSAENLSEIKIYDALGRCQATILPKNNAGIYEIQTEKLNSGVYFLQVKTAKGTFQKQFLKN